MALHPPGRTIRSRKVGSTTAALSHCNPALGLICRSFQVMGPFAGVRGLLVLRSHTADLKPAGTGGLFLCGQRLLRPPGNEFDGTTLRQWHDQRGNCRRMSSMVELVVAVVALVSACIFLAHAIEPRGIYIERLRDAPTEWNRQFEALGLNPKHWASARSPNHRRCRQCRRVFRL